MLAAPLPAPANATIGREGELAEIGALLTRPEVRLLTLVGTGGVGKTRLALEAGRTLAGRFPGGDRVRRSRGRRGRRARARRGGGARAWSRRRRPSSASGSRARPAARTRCSCWTASSASSPTPAQVAQLLAAAPNLTVLATSRAPLRLTAEHAYRVQPLAVSNAAALFAARVAASRADWAPPTRTTRRRGDLRAAGRAAAGDRAGRRPRAAAAAARRCWSASSAGWSC